jgi:hypothetical protein
VPCGGRGNVDICGILARVVREGFSRAVTFEGNTSDNCFEFKEIINI